MGFGGLRTIVYEACRGVQFAGISLMYLAGDVFVTQEHKSLDSLARALYTQIQLKGTFLPLACILFTALVFPASCVVFSFVLKSSQ